MKRSFFWLLLALIALSVVVNVAVADGSDDGSDDEADDAPPLAEGQAADQGDAQVEDDDDEDEDDEDDDGEDDLPPGAPRVHSKVSVVATLADLKDNVMHKELAQKVSFSFSNKATDTFNISVVWGRLYNAQKTHIIQNFSGFEVGHELKPDEEHSVEYAFVPHKQLEAGAEYFIELLGYFTPLVNTQSKHYIHTAFNATVKLQEKPGKFTGPMIFSVSLICIIVGGLYMIKNQIGPFSKKQKGFAPAQKSSSKTHSDDGNGFLDPQHAKRNPKKVSSK